MIATRRKGRAGELECAALLRELLGTATVTRNLAQTRDGGHDLLGLPGWCPEVKRAEKPRVSEWWAQAVHQANGAKPVLLYRLDHKLWRAVIALADLVPAFEGQPRIHMTVETSLEAFAAIVREAL